MGVWHCPSEKSCENINHRTYLHLRLCWDRRGFEVKGVQLLDAPSADGHCGVGQSYCSSPPGPAGAAACRIVLCPLLAGQGGASTGPEAH